MHTKTAPAMGPRTPIFHTSIHTGRMSAFIDTIISLGQAHQSSYTCCVNVHMMVESRTDHQLAEALEQSDLNTPDGMPIATCIQQLNHIPQERIAGMDLVPLLLAEAERRGASVYFFGDTESVLAQLVDSVQEKHPSLRIAGSYSPPFRVLSEEEENGIIDMINDAKPNIIFVALGCPKQEKWMLKHKGLIHGSMLGIGNAFRTFLGIEKRAPEWMQRFSLEWLYRFIQNPKRLWKRYFYSNSVFLFMLLSHILTSKKPHHQNTES